MSVREEFDAWAADGRDRGMEERHWHTAKHVLAQLPVEAEDTILDLGCGSGYALRALRERGVARGIGLDGAPAMAENAQSYTDDPAVGFVVGAFESLPVGENSVDHVVSMEAFYYAARPVEALREIRRVLRPGGTFACALNFFEESTHTHEWQAKLSVEMTLWNRGEYREAFRDAGFHVGSQTTIPDREIDIPPASEFPLDDFETREAMVDRYRTWGTLLTVGVAP